MSEVRSRSRLGTMPGTRHAGTQVNDSALKQDDPTAATMVQQPWPSSRQAWYGVTIFGLTVMTIFGSINLTGLLMQSIKVDLALTDTQVSTIVGFASAAFNAVASLPIPRLVDRMSRRLIIGIGLLTISVGSALTGLANGFWQLFAARLFSGIGGAGNG